MTVDVSRVLKKTPFPFEADGKTYQIRQLRTEEFDEAEFLARVARLRASRRSEVIEFKGEPCSIEARAMFEFEIQRLEEMFRNVDPDDELRRQAITARLASIRRRQDTYTLEEELTDEYASVVRDRFLCSVLLCDSAGRQIIGDPSTDEGLQQWEDLPMTVKEASRPAIWRALKLIEEIPFS